MVSSPTLTSLVDTPLDDGTTYRQVVGGIQYLCLTRPDIAFVVNKVSQYMHQAHDIHWIRIKLPRPPIVWCDNSSTMSLVANPVLHAQVKHVELDLHFVRDKVLSGNLQVNYVPGEISADASNSN
ncbi:hypothetical protein J1N35_008755 [Gossypium stocksii]|uniref:Reverse transcriptase Ty1/copia-type domain-containing protein n=1 Tax=Gossypium stocksii TaxID=47602 RepID=A0A9D4AES6_9ROSI|nr:hypothetical protein J1N35_008755 [Gossypium stocksii]